VKLATIVYDQAVHADILGVLEKHGIKGYTWWRDVHGSGETGIKDGSPIWPGLNIVLMTVIGEEKVAPLIEALHELKNSFPMTPGLRILVSDVEIH